MAVAFEQEFELYHYPESLCSQMVRVALEEKGLDWKSHVVMLNDVVVNGENFTPEYLAINPKGIVPTLVHNGKPVYDSWTIIDYLDEVQPDSGVALTPHEPGKRAHMEELVRQASLDESRPFGASLGMAIPILSAPVIRYCIKQQPLVKFWWKYRKHPMADRRWGARMVSILPIPELISQKSVKAVGRALRNIEQDLSHGEDYYLGDFSQVDIMMMAHFHRLEDVQLGCILEDEGLPNIAAYWQRLQARESYKSGITDWTEPTWRHAINEVFKGNPSPELDRIRQLALG